VSLEGKKGKVVKKCSMAATEKGSFFLIVQQEKWLLEGTDSVTVHKIPKKEHQGGLPWP
jgi:hypothetical protein